MTCKLHSHLADVEEHAESLLLRLVDEMAASEGITEQLKADVQTEWIKRINNIRQRVMEIVNYEVIYL